MRAMVDLTAEQQGVILGVVEGIKKKGRLVQTLGGYAGTGKTSVVAYMVLALRNFAVCSYTGKAAQVLRRKGVPASTIHSLIYRPLTQPDGSVSFQLADRLDCEGILVDEASMVTAEIDTDLRSFGLPVVYVGDHGQLPPVGNDFNLMAEPMYRLEKIHRNAGPIAHFCQWVRHGNPARAFPHRSGQVQFLRTWDVTPKILAQVDQTICAYNRTRVDLNDRTRSALGFGGLLQRGERVMCLRNNRTLGVFNGMQGYVRSLWTEKKKRHYLRFEADDVEVPRVLYDPKQFGQKKTVTEYGRDGPIPFDYAYAATAHKSQGDQFDDVLVFEQVCSLWPHPRWAYTAGSRAKERLRWVSA